MTPAPAFAARVVIVGKTRMGGGVCLGGIVESTHKPVRLLPVGKFCHPQDTPFQIGEVWEMTLRPRPGADAPHTEDRDEWGARRVGVVSDLVGFIRKNARVHTGDPSGLFGGLLQFRPSGSAYLQKTAPLPAWSVEFWAVPRQLVHATFEDKHRYRLGGKVPLLIPYVGLEEPLLIMPAGTIGRVSLARWWSSPTHPEEGEVCSLQLSGWFGAAANLPRVKDPNAPSSDDDEWGDGVNF